MGPVRKTLSLQASKLRVEHSLIKLFAGTTVGNGSHLYQWLVGVQRLFPAKITISIDDSRHSAIPDGLRCELIHYDSGKSWDGYEARHKNWLSDYSIGLGIKKLIESFLQTDCSHFVCIDSDVILDEGIATKIRKSSYEYLQIGAPAAIRERLGFIYLHWKSTNFGISKEIAMKLNPELDYNPMNSYPVDLKLHRKISALQPATITKVKSGGVLHYLNNKGKTRKVSTLEAQMRNLYTRPFMLFYGMVNPIKYPPIERS
jgi:hypothetical protein